MRIPEIKTAGKKFNPTERKGGRILETLYSNPKSLPFLGQYML